MKYAAILEKAERYRILSASADPMALQNWEQAFEIEYTHESTAIEGNTLTLMETKIVLEDKISVGGKNLREIYEVVNHLRAYRFIKDKISEGRLLDEKTVKDIHQLLMDNIFPGGYYRNVNVRITGASHTPPAPEEAFRQVKNFFADLQWKRSTVDPITYAAWTHAEFVRIHPFIDGNGRTCRLMMNYQLMSSGLLPLSIPKEIRLEYFRCLETYAEEGSIEPFADFIAALEDKRLDELLANFL